MIKKNIAILSPLKVSNTETFIQNHIKHIPHHNYVIYGTPFPYILDGKNSPSSKAYYSARLKALRSGKDKNTHYRELLLEENLKKNKINVVIAEFLDTGVNVLEICMKLKIPIIACAFGYDISITSHIEKYSKGYKKLFDYAVGIIIVSSHMKKKLLELGCPNEKIHYSPTGPNPVFFNIEPNYKNKNIVALGRFVDKKAPHITLFAIHKLKSEFPDIKLIFGGDGPLFHICKDLVIHLGIENNVDFVGYISQEKQYEIFQNARIFVQHSKIAPNGDSEGTPVAILEASAAGLPVVSTIHAGIPDVIVNGETGFLVPEGDVNAMAERIKQLLLSEEKTKELGINGKTFIRQNFSLENHINNINTIILNI